MDKRLVEKYFSNQTTTNQTRRVLEWFDTPEGKQYLRDRLDSDYELMDRNDLRKVVPELDSDKLYNSIQNKIGPERKKDTIHKRDWVGYAFKAAAAILVILSASLFTISQQRFAAEQNIEREHIHFQANNNEHREITLPDGSVVLLNSNSEIVISKDFMNGTREIELAGEAFFDVENRSDQPFIIHTNQSSVEVLGTSFNVRSLENQNNVQVSVVEGRVLFRGAEEKSESEQLSVVLSKNQYGILDLSNRSMNVDDIAVDNYIGWKSGRYIFNNQTLQQVCTLINRLHDVQCSFADDQMKNSRLTANFSKESLDKTLDVIALSLKFEFEYRADEKTIHWTM